MSNRTLIITVVILVLAFVGTIGAARVYQNSHTEQGVGQEPNTQAPDLKLAGNEPQTPDQSASCQRNFSTSKLKENSKMQIAGQQVQIDVKNFGSIKLELYDKDAPKAVENFLRLADSGYYDCLTFHRIGKSFMIQGGDPTGTGSGGESAFGKSFADELNPQTPSYKTGYVKGVLAMANSGPNTNGSQFFILVADYPLNHDYTIFGRVIAGQDVADKISNVDTTNGNVGAPVTPVVMESVKIIK